MAVNSVTPVGQNEENPQVQQMFDEQLSKVQKMKATMADQLQQITAENLRRSRSPQQTGQEPSGERSVTDVRQSLEELSARLNEIVKENSAFKIRFGVGVTETGDPIMLIIDKQTQEPRETIPTSQAIRLRNNMELFTDYFVGKFNQAGVLVDTFSK
jgi:uncharacterized FlaG/YvyC family protein